MDGGEGERKVWYDTFGLWEQKTLSLLLQETVSITISTTVVSEFRCYLSLIKSIEFTINHVQQSFKNVQVNYINHFHSFERIESTTLHNVDDDDTCAGTTSCNNKWVQIRP